MWPNRVEYEAGLYSNMSTDQSKLVDGVALGKRILSLYSRTLDSAGRLPIYKAVFDGRYKAVQDLLSYGFKVDSRLGIRLSYFGESGVRGKFVEVTQMTFCVEEIDDEIDDYAYDDTGEADDDDFSDDNDDTSADDDEDFIDDDEFRSFTHATSLWIASALGHDDDYDEEDDHYVNGYIASDCGPLDKFTRATSLWIASALGHTEVVRVLADAGASVGHRTNGIPALVVAACSGHSEVVRLLIERGASADSEDKFGNSAVFLSVGNGSLDTLECLVEAGADINASNLEDHSPIAVASSNGNIDVVKYLVKAGVDLDPDPAPLDCLKPSYTRDRPLTNAIRFSHKDVVKFLLEAGASCNATSLLTDQPHLQLSVECGHTEITELLINAGADIHASNLDDDADPNDEPKITALFLAGASGNSDDFKVLLDAGAAEGVERMFINMFKTSITEGHSEMIQLVACLLAKDCREDVRGSESMLQCTIDPEVIGNTDSLRMALILAKSCNVRVDEAQSHLVFRDTVDYSVFDQAMYLAHALSLPNNIYLTLPQVSELIQCPGIGSVSSISRRRMKDITHFTSKKVRSVVREYNMNAKKAFYKIGLVTTKACGSAAEGTKVGLPDEFDYTLRFYPRNAGKIVDFKDGYKFYQCRDTYSAESVLTGRGSKSFHDTLSEWLHINEESPTESRLETLPKISAVRGGGQANTEIRLEWRDRETDNLLLVSVDLVPVLFFENEWPEYLTQRTWMMDRETLKSRGFALVAKPPHRKSALASEISEEDRVKLWRISCPHLETEHIACLEPRVKNAYIVAKCLRDPEVCRIMLRDSDGIIHNVEKHVPSYLLKTAFLHNVEDFLRRNSSLIEMVYIIYCDLEYFLFRGFLPLFWQHDVNTLGGLRVDPKKALRATKLMREFVGRLYLRDTDCDELSESGEGREQFFEFEHHSGGVNDKKKQCHGKDEVTVSSRTHPQSGTNDSAGEGSNMLFEGEDEDSFIGNEKTGICLGEVEEATVYSRSLLIPRPVVYYVFTETGEPHPSEYKYDPWGLQLRNSDVGQK